MSVPIPTDADGYLRRECPTCGAQFKWHHGPANDETHTDSAATQYYCPLCGRSAHVDSWWTQEQIEYAQESAMPSVLQQLEHEIAAISITDLPALPPEMVEPNDMQIVASPCHDYEPVKIPDGHNGPVHCLVCGMQFAV
ncbi:hypothetical protein A5734_06625 [Mycolicibacterium fortuitum]|nr:hypothetical protein A5734_06625 [Mycolicibacterium fortuitum]